MLKIIKNKLTFHRPLPGLDKLAPFQHHQCSAGNFPGIHYGTRTSEQEIIERYTYSRFKSVTLSCASDLMPC